jgi:hypothetical protein
MLQIFSDHGDHLLRVDRFGEMRVHACRMIWKVPGQWQMEA